MAERSPGAWLELLEMRLHERWARWAVYDAYYEGDHQLAFATRKWREAFGAQFAQITDNWMPIVVDASAERLRVQGFRFGKDADEDAWDIWQANGLDAAASMLHTEAIKLGEAYWMVEPPRGDGDPPKITAEHPSQVIVASEPGDRLKRLAALKKWVDDDGFAYATVYLPTQIVKFRSKGALDKGGQTGGQVNWVRREGDEGGTNPLGVVPVVPVPNNPSLLRGGSSDLAGGPMDLQNAINKLLSDMLIGSEFQAYPQRVLLGVEPPKYPAGHANEGQIIPRAELEASQSRLWYFSKGKDQVDVKEFSAADLENFNKSIERLVGHLAAQTRTPPHYVLAEMVNISGDALKAAETGLTSKVRDKMDPFGESHEEAMRLAFLSMNKDDSRAQVTTAETIWRDPESRSQGELADSLVKLKTIGVPQEVLWERYGFSPTEIDRMLDMAETEAILAQSAELPPTNGQVPPEQAQEAVSASQPAQP